jgi:hypothetical protein
MGMGVLLVFTRSLGTRSVFFCELYFIPHKQAKFYRTGQKFHIAEPIKARYSPRRPSKPKGLAESLKVSLLGYYRGTCETLLVT